MLSVQSTAQVMDWGRTIGDVCDNSPLTLGFVHICKNKSILLTEKTSLPRSWFEVPKLARLCSELKSMSSV